MKDPKDKFTEDILEITKSQDAKIEKLSTLLFDNAKAIGDLIDIVKKGNQKATVEPIVKPENTYIVFTNATQSVSALPQEEFQKRTEEATKIIKPILVKHGISQFCAFLVQKKA